MKKLNEVNCHTTVKVAKLTATGLLRERLLALGITTGAMIDVIKKGPKNNLTVYNIRGAMIALREEEGSLILVQPM
ncbi:MAG: FeoA family protein [Turicibacter sp.]|nr:FeoA family protein [Turicibacter sp.]MDO5792756.1 FeoA family protein [Turicibacter sp.]